MAKPKQTKPRKITARRTKAWLAETPVHNYPTSFAKMNETCLPTLFKNLQLQIAEAIALEPFAEKDIGPAGLSSLESVNDHLDRHATSLQIAKAHTSKLRKKTTHEGHDFAGIYVFVSSSRPFYVGITRSIFARLQAHVRDSRHATASLLYNLLKTDQKYTGKRSGLKFKGKSAKEVRVWLKSPKVAILPLACPVERYALELYAAMELKTGVFNLFETH